MSSKENIWVARDYLKCTGCRRCEIACSLWHEEKIWPEASMVRVFMLVPGVEIPHLCAQCHDYPCVKSCPVKPVKALSVDDRTGAVLVDKELCISCARCIKACPGNIPFLHPSDNKAVICDLCRGDPQCVKVCQAAQYNALTMVKVPKSGMGSQNNRLFAKTPEELTKIVAPNIYGEKAEEMI